MRFGRHGRRSSWWVDRPLFLLRGWTTTRARWSIRCPLAKRTPLPVLTLCGTTDEIAILHRKIETLEGDVNRLLQHLGLAVVVTPITGGERKIVIQRGGSESVAEFRQKYGLEHEEKPNAV